MGRLISESQWVCKCGRLPPPSLAGARLVRKRCAGHQALRTQGRDQQAATFQQVNYPPKNKKNKILRCIRRRRHFSLRCHALCLQTAHWHIPQCVRTPVGAVGPSCPCHGRGRKSQRDKLLNLPRLAILSHVL